MLAGTTVTVAMALVNPMMNPVGDAVANADPSLNQPALSNGEPNSSIPRPIANQLPNARLAGEGLLRWFGFRIYQARLFVDEGYDNARPMQGPIALELTYKRHFDGQSIAERSADEISALDIGTKAQRAQWSARMVALFPDVTEGDRLAGILTASGKTLFVHNESFVGQIDDPAFGQAFFAIWLDERTSAPALRAQLIGKTESPTPLYESAQ